MFFGKKSRSNTRDKSSLSSDIAATRKAGIRTAILVTVLVSGIVPAFCMMFNPASEELPFVQQMQQLWSIALMTYPLTIVVATLTILRQRGILRFGNLFPATSIVIFCVSVGNTIGVFGGHEASVVKVDTSVDHAAFSPHVQFGYNQDQTWAGTVGSLSPQNQNSISSFAPPTPSSSQPRSFWDLPAACLGFFTSFLKLYGLRTFLASVLVGVFAGRTANRFLEYVPANRKETIGLAKEIYETHRQMNSPVRSMISKVSR
jgi:hypothetical protein